jgi:hypothetical protein
MFKRNKNIKIYLIVVILITLLLTNPSLSSFKNYALNIDDKQSVMYKRTFNLLLFSIYTKKWHNPTYIYHGETTIVTSSYGEITYLGIIGNFFILSEKY